MIVVDLTIEVHCARIVSVQAMHLASDHQTNYICCTRQLFFWNVAHFMREIKRLWTAECLWEAKLQYRARPSALLDIDWPPKGFVVNKVDILCYPIGLHVHRQLSDGDFDNASRSEPSFVLLFEGFKPGRCRF
jgi:hypothetical protein